MSKKRDLNITTRKEEVKEKNKVYASSIKITEIKERFEESIHYINNLSLVANELVTNGKVQAAEEIWRSQVAFLDSAFDYFLHEIVRYGTSQIFNGDWNQTEQYKSINISMEKLHHVLKNREDSTWFPEFICTLYERKCLMGYDTMKEQISLLGLSIELIANKVFPEASVTNKNAELKMKISDLYIRRNMIVHQFDRLHSNAQRNNISQIEVEGYLLLIKKIVCVICEEVSTKDASD